MIERRYTANFENLDAMREVVGAAARKFGFGEQDIYNLQLVVDEAATNIIEHTYENQTNQSLILKVSKDRENFVITLEDNGVRFIPDIIPTPAASPDLDTMNVGGLGLYFIHKLMDEVQYDFVEGQGNILRLKKRLPVTKKQGSIRSQGIKEVFILGQKLLNVPTLEGRKEAILETVRALIPGNAAIWLDESKLYLPDQVEDVFDSKPSTENQVRALSLKRPMRKLEGETLQYATPIVQDSTALGVIEISRHQGLPFSNSEKRLLDGIVSTISTAIVAWHQLDVERFRLRQLNLVRSVTNQITTEQDLGQLCRNVTRLIHSTFKYYYVGIYTLETGNVLKFKGGMGGSNRTYGHVQEIPIEVQFGNGMVGTAAADGEPKYAANTATDDLYIHLDILPETRSELALPLKLEDRVVGVLDLQSEKVDAFHPNDMLVLQTLADGIAKAVEVSILFSELRQQAHRVQLIAEVARQITTILDLGDLMQTVAELLSDSVGFQFVHLFTVHPNRRRIVYEAGSGPRAEAMEGYVIDLDDEEGIISWVARNAKPALLNDARTDPRYVDSPLAPFTTRSELCVPLIFNNQVNGLIDIQSEQTDAFTNEDQILLETLADSIAAAIRNADLYRSEQWRRQTGDSLREVAGLLSASASLEQVLDSILTELERNLPADYSAIWFGEEDAIHCAAAHHVDPLALEAIRDGDEAGFEVIRNAMFATAPVIRRKEDPIGPSAVYGGFDLNHSAIYVPLKVGQQAVGVLSLVHHTPGRYGHEASAMTTTFGSYASVAIENARLYDAAQEQAYASAALLQVAQAVVSLTTLEDILTTITRILPILVGVQRVAIFGSHPTEGFTPIEEYGISGESREIFWHTYPVGTFPLLDVAAAEQNQTLSSESARGFENWSNAKVVPTNQTELAMNSEDPLLVAIPLIMKGEVLGVMLVEEADGGRRFRGRRFEILNGVAQQIAMALQNESYQLEKQARERLDLEVRVARQIQETFIPKNVIMPDGWTLAGTWITATQMGGDLYDVLRLPHSKVGIFIADVADKGIPAALFMALTRSLLHAGVLLYDEPAEVLNWVNSKLYPDCEQGMFVTAFFGILDEKSGLMRYCNAGHNPPYLVMGDSIDRLTRTGIALGVLEEPSNQQAEVNLKSGQLLCLYTDGVTESFAPDGAAFGEEGLVTVLHQHQKLAPEALLNEILDEVNTFTNNAPLRDDISLVILRCELPISKPKKR